MTNLQLDDRDCALLLEVLAMASNRYHALQGYAQDKGEEGRALHYKINKGFCDELSDQLINKIGRCS